MSSDRNGFEWLRVITPVLTGVSLFVVGLIYGEVAQVRELILQHITNHELHIPRADLLEIRHNGIRQAERLEKLIKEELANYTMSKLGVMEDARLRK